MTTGRIACLIGLAACGSGESVPPDAAALNPCEIVDTVPGGSAEPGLGDEFSPIVDGQDATLELGIQGLYMFVTSARVRDLDVGAGDQRGAVRFSAVDAAGVQLSLELGCRAREFADVGDGSRQLTTTYEMPFPPEVSDNLEGASVTIRLDVRDHMGRQATDQRTVVAHKP